MVLSELNVLGQIAGIFTSGPTLNDKMVRCLGYPHRRRLYITPRFRIPKAARLQDRFKWVNEWEDLGNNTYIGTGTQRGKDKTVTITQEDENKWVCNIFTQYYFDKYMKRYDLAHLPQLHERRKAEAMESATEILMIGTRHEGEIGFLKLDFDVDLKSGAIAPDLNVNGEPAVVDAIEKYTLYFRENRRYRRRYGNGGVISAAHLDDIADVTNVRLKIEVRSGDDTHRSTNQIK